MKMWFNQPKGNISPKFWDNLSKKEKRLILDEYSNKSMDYQAKRKVFWSQFNFLKQKYHLKGSP